MSNIDIQLLSRQMTEWAKEAGKLSVQRRIAGTFEISYKSSPSDLVTAVDKEIEAFIIEKILSHYPDHGVIGEEGLFERDPKEFETLWIIDPIDGTTNFVHQGINYVISLAVVHQGKGLIGVIYDPTRDELFYGEKGKGAFLNDQEMHMAKPVTLQESVICTNLFLNQRIERFGLTAMLRELPKRCRGIRMFGCAALEMAYVAAGRVDACVSLHLNPWDFAAGKIIVEQAAGKVSTIEGHVLPFDQASSVLACNPKIHHDLLMLLQHTSTD